MRIEWNSRVVRTAGIAAALLFVFAGFSAAADRQGPRIYLQESRFDIGTVEQGAVPEHIFEIKNLGDEVLEIGRVQPT